MSTVGDSILALLVTELPGERSGTMLKHYSEMLGELQRSHWESATVKAGKFAEAVLKCLWEYCGLVLPADRDFKVDKVINNLPQDAPPGTPDAVRLTIPRACRFVYDVASNRGARHDSGELDPNVMDASGTFAVCSWVLAELVRFSQKGKLSPPGAAEIVSKLSQKRYPLFEEIDGRLYFANTSLGARKLALSLLAYPYPARMDKEELILALTRHGETRANARLALNRIKLLIDDDDKGAIKLRASGLKEAEQILGTITE